MATHLALLKISKYIDKKMNFWTIVLGANIGRVLLWVLRNCLEASA